MAQSDKQAGQGGQGSNGSQAKQVACPGCSGKQPYQRPTTIYFCQKCRCQFDDDPFEGGGCFDDPTKRIELEEQRESRQRRPHNANVLSQRATVMRRGAVRRT